MKRNREQGRKRKKEGEKRENLRFEALSFNIQCGTGNLG
ncbi:hypothetical protein V6Z11_A05G165000 [Gossypium hirsutum]